MTLIEFSDLLKLTQDIRLEREKRAAKERGEVHPEERKKAEAALDQTLNKLGVVEIDGIKFNQFGNQQHSFPVSKRRKKRTEEKDPNNKGTST